MKQKPDIRFFNLKEIEKYIEAQQLPKFRAKQLFEWLWHTPVRSFESMSNLPKAMRENLANDFDFVAASVELMQESSDGTIKFAFRLHDGLFTEGVLIPSTERFTACISVQVGCPLGCKFCATGSLKFARNLTSGEIFDQVILIQQVLTEKHNKKLDNIVVMGMGEPLLNLDNMMFALNRLSDPTGLNISPRRITISTAGLTDKVRLLANAGCKYNLAISLHTADNNKRMNIMPVNKAHPLPALSEAIRYFHEKTEQRITFEYLMLADFNDSISDAKLLAEFCKIVPCKVNIIHYNPVEKSIYKKATDERVAEFVKFLEGKNMVINLRRSMGKDIDAACGQLANKAKKKVIEDKAL